MKIVKNALPLMAASVLCVAGGCGKVEVTESAAPASEYVSPEFLALSADGQSVFATSATGSRIVNVSLDGFASRTWKVSSVSAGVPVNPTGIAVGKNGSVYVTCGVQSGELQ